VQEIEDQIKEFVISELARKANAKGIDLGGIEEDLNLVKSGIIDSFGFLELIIPIEKKFNINIDFSELDPQDFTSLKGLARHCAQQVQLTHNQSR